MTELWQDSVTLPLPTSRDELSQALDQLKLGRLVAGYRGQPAGDREGLIEALLAVQDLALAHKGTLVELDVNPLMIHQNGEGVTAVDAVLRVKEA